MLRSRDDLHKAQHELDRHASDSEPLPLVAITGTRGKSTTAWLLYRMVRAHQRTSALWCSSGVYVDGQRMEGELLPWSAVVRALLAGELDIAIQELEAPVVATVGLPERMYAFGAITTLCGNDDACLATPESRFAFRAHDIVARAVHPSGFLVLNADDPAVLELADRCHSRVALFALHPENPALRRARRRGLPALWFRDGTIVANAAALGRGIRPQASGSEAESEPLVPPHTAAPEKRSPPEEAAEHPIIDVEDAPCTLGGSLTFQIQNIMCASALALLLGVPLPTIRAVIRTFLPDVHALPGSCNVLAVRGHDVLIDGARYPWSLRTLVRGIRHHNPRRTIVLTHAYPWLSEEDVRELGRVLGRLNGVIVLAEPMTEQRYRAFQEGIVQNPYPPVLMVQPDFASGLRSLLSLAQPGDLCLVLAAEPERTIALLENLESDDQNSGRVE